MNVSSPTAQEFAQVRSALDAIAQLDLNVVCQFFGPCQGSFELYARVKALQDL